MRQTREDQPPIKRNDGRLLGSQILGLQLSDSKRATRATRHRGVGMFTARHILVPRQSSLQVLHTPRLRGSALRMGRMQTSVISGFLRTLSVFLLFLSREFWSRFERLTSVNQSDTTRSALSCILGAADVHVAGSFSSAGSRFDLSPCTQNQSSTSPASQSRSRTS